MSSWLLIIQQSQQPTLKWLSPIHTGSVLPILHIPPDPPNHVPFSADQQPSASNTNSVALATTPVVPNLAHQHQPTPKEPQLHHPPPLPTIRCKPHTSHSFMSALTQMAASNYHPPWCTTSTINLPLDTQLHNLALNPSRYLFNHYAATYMCVSLYLKYGS